MKRIIGKIIEGNASYFRHIVKKYEKDIFYYFFRMTKNYDDSNDLSQEVFLRAYKYLSTYNDKYTFSTWLFRIAHNCLIDHWKKRNKGAISIEKLKDKYHYELTNGEKVSEKAEWNELKKQVKKAIFSLPSSFREVMILRVIEEKSYEEISDITGASMSSVKVRIHRARKAIKNILKEYYERGKK